MRGVGALEAARRCGGDSTHDAMAPRGTGGLGRHLGVVGGRTPDRIFLTTPKPQPRTPAGIRRTSAGHPAGISRTLGHPDTRTSGRPDTWTPGGGRCNTSCRPFGVVKKIAIDVRPPTTLGVAPDGVPGGVVVGGPPVLILDATPVACFVPPFPASSAPRPKNFLWGMTSVRHTSGTRPYKRTGGPPTTTPWPGGGTRGGGSAQTRSHFFDDT